VEEFGNLLNELGMGLQKDELLVLMNVLDTDNNGTIELKEFEAFLLKPDEKDKKVVLKKIFDEYARETGLLDMNQFRELLEKVGDILDAQQIATVINDIKGHPASKKITFEELCDWIDN